MSGTARIPITDGPAPALETPLPPDAQRHDNPSHLRSPAKPLKVAVVGDGIGALAVAHFLLRLGTRVAFYGAPSASKCTIHGPTENPIYYIHPTDDHLLSLLSDLQLDFSVRWRRLDTGIIYRGSYFPATTPYDFLRSRPLALLQRLRMCMATWLALRHRSPEDLADRPAREWLLRVFGRTCFDVFWKTVLRERYGDEYHSISALWAWNLLDREWQPRPRVAGTLPGGMETLIGALTRELVNAGVVMRTTCPVEHLVEQRVGVSVASRAGVECYDTAVACVPTRTLQHLLRRENGDAAAAAPVAPSQGTIRVLLGLDRERISSNKCAVVDSGVSFQEIRDATPFFYPNGSERKGVIQIIAYGPSTHFHFAEDDGRLVSRFIAEMKTLPLLHPFLGATWACVSRSPHGVPLCRVNHSRSGHPLVLSPGRLYSLDASHVHQGDSPWNALVKQAALVVECIESRVFPPPPPIQLHAIPEDGA